MKPTDIPVEWRRALNLVKSVAHEAVLAGGCLRDLDHGVPFKDLDIFVSAFGTYSDGALQERAGAYYPMHGPGVVFNRARRIDFTSCAFDTDCISSSEVWVYGLPLNIVTLAYVDLSLTKVLDRMDFGLCQIGFDGFRLMTTEAYDRDRHDESFTLLRADSLSDKLRSYDRFRRLGVKYPRHKLVDHTG